VLQPEGVAVVIEATDMCMVMRGVQKQHLMTSTSAMSGGPHCPFGTSLPGGERDSYFEGTSSLSLPLGEMSRQRQRVPATESASDRECQRQRVPATERASDREGQRQRGPATERASDREGQRQRVPATESASDREGQRQRGPAEPGSLGPGSFCLPRQRQETTAVQVIG